MGDLILPSDGKPGMKIEFHNRSEEIEELMFGDVRFSLEPGECKTFLCISKSRDEIEWVS